MGRESGLDCWIIRSEVGLLGFWSMGRHDEVWAAFPWIAWAQNMLSSSGPFHFIGMSLVLL